MPATSAGRRWRPGQTVLLQRAGELAALASAVTAAGQGKGSFLLIEGPAGIGKTALLRTALTSVPEQDWQVLTARGFSLEADFSYGVVRQLFDPVRAAAGPRGWASLLEGAATLAGRVFDGAAVAPVEEDAPYAAMHGLFWLAANLAARRPLVIAVDDVHWADPASLRWFTHLAGRLDGLPILLVIAARSGPGASAPGVMGELRSGVPCQVLQPAPLAGPAAAVLVRERLGAQASEDLCRACHTSTGGNPFLLESLLAAVCGAGVAPGSDLVAIVERLAPEPVAQAVLRLVSQLPPGSAALTRALAVLGKPAPLRHVAALAGQDQAGAALLADGLREANVFAPGALLDFAHPIVRSAVYDAIPPGERALAHAAAARLLGDDGAGAEELALHLIRSEPAGNAEVAGLLREAARRASGRGDPGTAAICLRRALDEPPGPAARPGMLLELGLALAGGRDRAAPAALAEAVTLASGGPAHASAALGSARVLGIWAYHDDVAAICREALAAGGAPSPEHADSLAAELAANEFVNPATMKQARDLTRRHAGPGSSTQWRIAAALLDTIEAKPADDTLAALAPVLAEGPGALAPDSLAAVYLLLVLIWNDELITAGRICDMVLRAARSRGSMSMVAHASCLRSMISRRQGQLEDAESEGRLALDFKLATSPPLAVAWAAAFCIEALSGLGQFGEAEAIADLTAAREPPPGYLHTLMFVQARGGLRVAQARFADGLDDLLAAGEGWRRLGVDHPGVADWRSDAVAAHAALGQRQAAASLAEEQLALARRARCPLPLAAALRGAAAVAPAAQAEMLAAEAVAVLEPTPARLELARALYDLGAACRRAGRRADARAPLLRALDLAQRARAAPLAAHARRELTAAGARPRRTALTGPDALTAAERQVADLAASGLTNRQIAQHLFVTLPTVETHLRHTFAKLGVSSRTELPGLLAPVPTEGGSPAPA